MKSAIAAALASMLATGLLLTALPAQAQQTVTVPADFVQRFEAMEKRVQRMEDVEAIRRLQYTYNYYNSSRLYAQVLDLISPNAETIEIAGRGVFNGKAGFAKNFHPDPDGVVRDKGVEFGFVLFQLAGQDIITVADDGKSALGRVRVFTSIYDKFPDALPRFNGGDYEMKFVKENGKWLISRMKYVHNFSVTHEKDGSVRPGYSTAADPKADGPTTWYHPWPETGVLPFHFPNPISGKTPPDVAGKQQYWIGNWPGEFPKSGHR